MKGYRGVRMRVEEELREWWYSAVLHAVLLTRE